MKKITPGLLRFQKIISLASGIIAGAAWGFYLPSVFQNASKPGLTAAVMGAAALAAFRLLASCRRFYGIVSAVLIALAFFGRFLLSSGLFPLAADGLLFGVVLFAGYAGNRMDRRGFAAAFWLTAALNGMHLLSVVAGPVLLYPVMFLLGAMRLPLRRSGRFILLLTVLPVAISSLAFRQVQLPPLPPLAGLSAACLPDSIQPRMLRVGKMHSGIGSLWRQLPFAGGRELAGASKSPYQEKILPGAPGTALQRSPEEYDLIFVEELPPGDCRKFCEAAWQKLDSESGVLVLPADRRALLPKLQWHPLPGSSGRCAAAFRGKTPALEPEAVDSMLQRKLADADAEHFIPDGVLSALLEPEESALPELPEPEKTGLPVFWIALAGYLLLAALSARNEKRELRLAAVANGSATWLLLLTAFQYCRSQYLFSGVSPLWVFAAFGLLFAGTALPPFLRRFAGVMELAAVCWWFLNPQLVLPALTAAALCGYNAAVEHKDLCNMKVLPRLQLDTALLFGAALGGFLFLQLVPQESSPLFPCALLAMLVRLVALLRR